MRCACRRTIFTSGNDDRKIRGRQRHGKVAPCREFQTRAREGEIIVQASHVGLRSRRPPLFLDAQVRAAMLAAGTPCAADADARCAKPYNALASEPASVVSALPAPSVVAMR